MSSSNERRFSLEKVEVDPSIKNRIRSADGEETLGMWDGVDIQDLIKELDRIEERYDVSYNNLPHLSNLPEEFHDQVEKDYPIWACDQSGVCLVGEYSDKTNTLDEIREYYGKKYGGIDKYKQKIQEEREKMIEQLKK